MIHETALVTIERPLSSSRQLIGASFEPKNAIATKFPAQLFHVCPSKTGSGVHATREKLSVLPRDSELAGFCMSAVRNSYFRGHVGTLTLNTGLIKIFEKTSMRRSGYALMGRSLASSPSSLTGDRHTSGLGVPRTKKLTTFGDTLIVAYPREPLLQGLGKQF